MSAAASAPSIRSCAAASASRPYGDGQCGASNPASAKATRRSSAGSAAIRATSSRNAASSPTSTPKVRSVPARASEAA